MAADLTQLIRRLQAGDGSAISGVYRMAASRLREMSAALLRRESHATMQPSDLMQEAYLQKVRKLPQGPTIQDSDHFFRLLWRGMQQILIDKSRARRSSKRTSPATHFAPLATAEEELLWRMGLEKLRQMDPRSAEVLRLRGEEGLTREQVAAALKVNIYEVRKAEATAVRWLKRHYSRRFPA